ncbi:prephenate dehydratase [Candidatus Woesearchaeota archaeon]|nr:prephenate dehydratase [Candidatus Woesearchaeota archaeon]
MRIATLGPEGTFSHEAVLKYDNEAEIIFKYTIWDVFDAVKNNEVDKGIVPLENSVSGTIGLTLDSLMHFGLKIIKEIIIPVKHNLAGNSKINELKFLYSHPQTFAQCEKFIRDKLNEIEFIPTSSNAVSAEKLSKAKRKGAGAIVPNPAMKKYKLKCLARDIQDNRFNVTRFAVIDMECAKKTGNDRTSISIYPHMDKPGLLYQLIGEFARRKINLTKIESRPSKGRLGDYIFFIDLQGHKDDKEVKAALKAIEKNFFIQILGSYPREY